MTNQHFWINQLKSVEFCSCDANETLDIFRRVSYIECRKVTFCFDSVGWASVRASDLQKLSDEALVWLSVWSEVQIVRIYGSADASASKLHHLLPHLNPDWFYFSGTGLPRLS